MWWGKNEQQREGGSFFTSSSGYAHTCKCDTRVGFCHKLILSKYFCFCFFAANLKKICKAIVDAPTDDERLKAFAPIQEMLTFVQFANDECDYGMGYELGMDLFCYGSHVSTTRIILHKIMHCFMHGPGVVLCRRSLFPTLLRNYP